jgi:hypothetical protein
MLKIRGAAAVGPRERVVLVEVADRILVLGVAPGRVNTLHTLDAADLPGIPMEAAPFPAARTSRAGSSRPSNGVPDETPPPHVPALRPLLLLLPLPVLAQALPALTSTPAGGGGTQYSLSMQTLLLLTSLSFLPAVVLMMTSFTRIIIVMSLLRHALGTQTSPPTR